MIKEEVVTINGKTTKVELFQWEEDNKFAVRTKGVNHGDWSIQTLPNQDVATRIYEAQLKGIDLNIPMCVGCDTEENVKSYPARKGTTTNYCPTCWLERYTVKAGN